MFLERLLRAHTGNLAPILPCVKADFIWCIIQKTPHERTFANHAKRVFNLARRLSPGSINKDIVVLGALFLRTNPQRQAA